MSKELRERALANRELRKTLKIEPWINMRNRLVYALAGKRRELGITQTDLAKTMDAPQSSITRFENVAVVKKGKVVSPTNPTMKFIASYATALGYDIDFKLIPRETSVD